MTEAFISYHHDNDQYYRNHLVYLAENWGAFEDCSVELGDIDDTLSSQAIRRIIRDEYLRETEVTILLCGAETRFRKHVDWELKSSMIDGAINKQSGILVIDLPESKNNTWYASLPGEKEAVYPDYTDWYPIETKAGFQGLFPDLPERIIDNLVKPDVTLSVVPWNRIYDNPGRLKFLVDATARAGKTNAYDLSLRMKRKNYNPPLRYGFF